MCGIAGLFGFDVNYEVNRDHLQAMCDVMLHRGPDDEGIYCQGPIGLGMRRLKIIDLDTGQQPMTNEDGSVIVVFNGEIYNYQALRQELVQKGHQFRSQSDTEVLVHLYEERGEQFLQELNGMFAIALWDRRSETLILARDRFGEKPLHYQITDDTVAFASEIKSILCTLPSTPSIDPEAAYHYFLSHFIPAPLSIYKGVRKVLPGHYLRCSKGQVREIKYWDFSYEPDEAHNEAYFAEGLYELLEDAVRLRLLSDVPLGAFLSGGIDSSIVVGLMSQIMDRPVQTFSIGFEDGDHDESHYAEQVAASFGAEHHAQVVKPSAMDWLQRLVWHCDEPFADSSALPTFLLCEMTRREVTVALSGDGGDELFGGYDRYLRIQQRHKWRMMPQVLRQQLSGYGQRLPRYARGKAFLQSLALDDYHFFCHGLRPLEAQQLLAPEFLGQLGEPSPYRFADSYRLPSRAGEYLSPFMYYDAKVYLPDDILVKVDRMSMAHSLETRQPFLDHRIAEFVARIPARFKVRQRLGQSMTKYILKQSCQHFLPQETLNRRKHGFTLPVDQWFRHELRDMVLDLLSADHLRQVGVLNPVTVPRLVAEHLEGKRNHKEVLWACLVFVLWSANQRLNVPAVGVL